ncbi:hypothetical protein ACHAQA_006882 [Verticillium albo-atrum]
MEWTTYINRTPLSPEILRSIYTSDQSMYPAPLPFERLEAWVAAAPELSISFHAGDTLVGVVVALPLAVPAWQALGAGTLREVDVDAARDFSRTKGEAVGVHVFHVERLVEEVQGSSVKGFAQFAVGEVVKAAQGEGYIVEGVSALTATEEGRRSFEKLGFAASGYEEAWVKPPSGNGPAELVKGGSGAVGIDEARRSGRLVTEARMMVRRGTS